MRILKIILTFICLAKIIPVAGQITLEHEYYNRKLLYHIKLESSGDKYASVKPNQDLIQIYNTDHSLFKTINIPPQPQKTFYDVAFITEKLFNLDTTDIEYLITGFDSTGEYFTSIYNEFGNLLFHRDSVFPLDFLGVVGLLIPSTPIFNIDSSAVMILMTYVNINNDFYVYRLPGKIESDCCDDFATNIYNQDLPHRFVFNTFPNPSKGKTILQYELPEGIKKAELIIYSLNGIEIKRYQITNAFKSFELDNSDLSSGTYFYQLLLANSNFGTKKMLVIK